MTNQKPPRWDLTNVYPGLESEEFQNSLADFKTKLQLLQNYFKETALKADEDTSVDLLAQISTEVIHQFNDTLRLGLTLQAYIYSFISTDSYNKTALRIHSEFNQLEVLLRLQDVAMQNFFGKFAQKIPQILEGSQTAKAHAFMLREAIEQSQYLMSTQEEALAAELSISGGMGWSKLQGTITSQLSVDFELDGKTEKLPMPALINLHSHSSEEVRKRAYETELAAWETVKEPLAAALNGVKGEAITLNRHRGRQDSLHSALDAARIDRETLEVMLAAMQASLPAFRKYYRRKANRFGSKKLPWWNLYAPAGKIRTTYSFEDARNFILEHFSNFSNDLSTFAQKAFDHNWIDAEQRSGKRGGAFCMDVPGVNESRILCNFDGTLDQVSTIAHELGHGFHNDLMAKAGKTELQKVTPMTLAETASILCETIIVNATLSQAGDTEEELAILETSLIGDSQVIVDIYSRYLFEKEVFKRREKAELPADELCEIMESAQKAAYGDGLDETHLHKYMWTWKPHYYEPTLSYYNFPYAFGLLFGTGLYAIYQQRGAEFIPEYKHLLASTGEGSAADLAARFGINIRSQDFWANSLKVIEARIDRYVSL